MSTIYWVFFCVEALFLRPGLLYLSTNLILRGQVSTYLAPRRVILVIGLVRGQVFTYLAPRRVVYSDGHGACSARRDATRSRYATLR